MLTASKCQTSCKSKRTCIEVPHQREPTCPLDATAAGGARAVNDTTPNLPTKNLPAKIAWLKLSGKSPMGLGIPPRRIKILLESNPVKSRILVLVRILAVWTLGRGQRGHASPDSQREGIMGCDIHTHAHAQEGLQNIFLEQMGAV